MNPEKFNEHMMFLHNYAKKNNIIFKVTKKNIVIEELSNG